MRPPPSSSSLAIDNFDDDTTDAGEKIFLAAEDDVATFVVAGALDVTAKASQLATATAATRKRVERKRFMVKIINCG